MAILRKAFFLFGMVVLVFMALCGLLFTIVGSVENTTDMAVFGVVMLILATTTMVFLERRDPFKELRRQNREKQQKKKLAKLNSLQTASFVVDEMSLPDVVEVTVVEDQAAMVFFETGQASISILQRKLYLGYAASARIVDRLEELGVVGPFSGETPRLLLMSQSAYESRKRIVSAPKEVPQSPINNTPNDFFKYGGIDAELLSVDLMEGHEFEYWCADLLRKLGFTNVEVTPGSGDQGVDILAQKDGIKYAVQCKCYASELGNKPIQEVHAGQSLYHCHVGAVMTNRHFTSGGRQLAEATGVLLWDRDWITNALKATTSNSTEVSCETDT